MSKEKELFENLEEIKKLKNYDGEKLIYSLYHLTSQLLYFYKLVAKGGDATNVSYHRKNQNYEHKLVYINIGRGFPKELMDGHWCYVIKDMGYKLLVVPATSIKVDSIIKEDYHLVIESEDRNYKQYVSRLSLTDIRTIDVQRIDVRKEILDVKTDRKYISEYIKNKLFNDWFLGEFNIKYKQVNN